MVYGKDMTNRKLGTHVELIKAFEYVDRNGNVHIAEENGHGQEDWQTKRGIGVGGTCWGGRARPGRGRML